MSNDGDRQERPFSWWDKPHWKPQPPAARETHRPGHGEPSELPQGEKKWRLNNPKKRQRT
jgi:hypothetical protein